MSEQPNSVGIEDVLTSIRRLVSEEMRPAGREARISVRMQAAQMDKLILTSAYRVTETPAEPAEGDMALVTTEIASPDRHFDAVVVDLSARKGQAIASEMKPYTAPQALLHPEVTEAVHAVLHGQPAQPVPSETIEEAVLVLDDRYVTSITGPDLSMEVPMDMVPNGDGLEETVLEDGIPAETQPFAFADVQALISEDIVALSASILARDDPAEMPAPDRSDMDDVAVPQFRTARIDAGQTLMAANLDHALPVAPLASRDASPVDLMDEDVLRGIVREIILAEFQGVMGERITANVRKLVRAEINRAIAANGLT
jgi:hypothetical protein